MYKKIINGFIDHPIVTSFFVADFLILMFQRPHWFFSLVMLGGLAVGGMYLGQKTAPFK